MTEDEFWALIEQARTDTDDDYEEVPARVTELASAWPAGKIVEAARWQELVDARGYTWELWFAAYLINGGCSDDGFDYFRGWLLTKGRAVWEMALADPDSLAGLSDVRIMTYAVECEDMLGALGAAYDRVTGEQYGIYPALKELGLQPPVRDLGADEWDFDDEDEARLRLPRLAALYVDN